MPLDASTYTPTMTRLEKLERLDWHLSQATDEEQIDFCSCVYHRVAMDPVFAAAGLSVKPVHEMRPGTLFDSMDKAAMFFGFTYAKGLFDNKTVKTKRAFLSRLISAEHPRTQAETVGEG